MSIIQTESQKGNGLSIKKICEALSVSRSFYYRYSASPKVKQKARDSILLPEIEKAVLVKRKYGYRRVTRYLRENGHIVNHKRVLRVMRAEKLLCKRKKKFVKTTDSNHSGKIYPNVAKGLVLQGINQLWVSDITYIRVGGIFVYLAVILDVYSRRCVGWSMDRTLEASLPLKALEKAISERQPNGSLVHHSDRGVQYASKDYTAMLKKNGITISMSRKGNPYDNAYAESFIKTIKYEEVYLYDYQSLREAKESVREYIQEIYNKDRYHSGIGYQSPEDFEKNLTKLEAIA